MKSEHRHELAENDLEVFINKLRARFAEAVELNGNRIMLWTSAVLLVLAVVIFTSRSSGSANANGWAALIGAQSPEELAGVADDYPGEPVGQWARLNVGERYMQSGIRLMFTDREAGKTDLEVSQTAFETVLNEKEISDAIRERALFGLARVQESTSDGDLKPAIDTYQKLISEFPNSPYKTVVDAKITELEEKSTQDFYAWFAAQNPQPEDLELPTDLQGMIPGATITPTDGAKPGLPLTVPTLPELPPTPGEKKATTEKPATTKKSETKKVEEKPETTKPAETTPAPVKKEEAKPATEPTTKKKTDEKKEAPPVPETKTPESDAK